MLQYPPSGRLEIELATSIADGGVTRWLAQGWAREMRPLITEAADSRGNLMLEKRQFLIRRG